MNASNLKGLAYLAVRALAIFAFILGLQRLMLVYENTIPFYMNLLELNPDKNVNIVTENIVILALLSGIPALVLIGFGILFWGMAGKLAHIVASRGDEESARTEIPPQLRAIESILLSVTGLVLIILAAGRIALILTQDLYMESTLPGIHLA